MKLTLVLASFLVGNFLFAAQPPDIGHFKGLAFSSATDRHPVEIDGGTLVKCEVPANIHSDITHCEVDKGTLTVSGTEWSALNVKLTSVSVLRTTGKEPARYYYLKGTTDLQIGAQKVVTAVRITLSFEDSAPNRVRGLIELPEQYSKTSLDAYLVP